MNTDVLSKLNLNPFKPLRYMTNARAQTIVAAYLPSLVFVNNAVRHVVALSDGDKIVLTENRPSHWQLGQRIVLLVHGLAGSHLSPYMVRMAALLIQQGYLVMRMDLRGCGFGIGLAKYPYHSGRSEDTRQAIQWLAQHYPASPVTQIGFSLGGNITLKMAGEEGAQPAGNLDSVIAVSPPLDLAECVEIITDKKNKLFDSHFVKELQKDIKKVHRFFPEIALPHFPPNLNLYQFDDIYTAPRSGYANAKEYYQQCSSKYFIDNIKLPTFILYATDDPLISPNAYLKIAQRSKLDMIITKNGGHVGWLGEMDSAWNYRWMDKTLIAWINWFDKYAA